MAVTDIPRLDDLSLEPGTRVLVRANMNVPLKDGEITDDLRITSALPTIKALLDRGAAVVLCCHLGRPKGEVKPELSVKPVAARVSELLGVPVPVAPEVVGSEAQAMAEALGPGEIMMIENVRFGPGETKNDPEFAKALTALGERYVNEAFGDSHRSHASIVGPPATLPSAGGELLVREVDALGGLLGTPAKPFVGILGGAKVSDKLGVIGALLEHCDQVLVGGAMAFTFVVAQGGSVGNSLVEVDQVDACKKLLETGRVTIPTDVVIAEEMTEGVPTKTVPIGSIPDGWMGLDIGPETAGTYADAVADAKTVLWNGPMGVFEIPEFAAGTRTVAEAVADADAFTVIGGGDSAAAIREMGFADQVDWVSTGGGASLELLELGDLPGLQALRRAE